jgi:hypothetical protein
LSWAGCAAVLSIAEALRRRIQSPAPVAAARAPDSL